MLFRSERVGRRRCERLFEWNHEQMTHAEFADKANLVRGGSEQARRKFRPQYADRMRIKCDDDRRSVRLFRVIERPFDHRAMSQMHAVEDTDGKDERTRDAGEFFDGMERGQRRRRSGLRDVWIGGQSNETCAADN